MATDALRSDAFAAQASINVTPLVDVLLVLLMILILTTPLSIKRVPLPLGGEPGASPRQDLRLAIKSGGELYLDGVAVSRSQLSAALVAAATRAEPPLLELQPDADVRYDDMLDTLVLAQDSGLASIHVRGVRASD
jgi:biopolymer transport protein ExbD